MKSKNRIALIAAIVVLLVVAATTYWFSYGRYMQSTDNAYLHGNITTISAQVSGTVMRSDVTDNQKVKAGQLLAQIDPRQYREQLNEATANLALTQAQLSNLKATKTLQMALIHQAEAEVKSALAKRDQSYKELVRQQSLSKKHYVSQNTLDQAQSDLKVTNAGLQQAQASLHAAKDKLQVLDTQLAEATANIDKSEAAVSQAKLNLSFTEIHAPVDGIIGQRSLRKGMLAEVGQPLLSLVPTNKIWLVANFKETQVGQMRVGQKVKIKIDALSGVTLHGHIDSLSPATGSQFALLPAENATGNFTKIVQRVPVKILIDDAAGIRSELRPGLSAEVTVDTRG
ncbi:HlyD family secretion protein [Dongshaea marina]|uniref:HlyD family secretion protein n=1 Tax=Dongshaea marina TaxID=2047966 RepID=UPI000D3E0EAE|nr:HlyD family secretion protein [Dongshaea marina]